MGLGTCLIGFAAIPLIKDGRISEDMEKAVSRELMPRDAYYRAAQEMIEQMRTSQ